MTEKLYDEDAYRRTFFAHVTQCLKKDGKYLVSLDRTAFYPEGGGQPSDTGVLNFVNVLGVHEKSGEIFHTTDKPLPAGAAVTGGVNWSRRFRLMQQHTGEHIVSGIAHRLFGGDNVGFHMGEEFLTVDWSRPLDADQLATVERLANEAVTKNLPVRAEYPPREALSRLNYRSKKELTGAVRIVTVPGYDVCACCGTHVAHTGEIGAIKVVGSQNYKGGTRFFLVCGAQALEDYGEKLKSVAAVSSLLSAKPEEIARAVKRLLDENAEQKHGLSALLEKFLAGKAASVPANRGDVYACEEGLSPEALRRYALLLAERCGGTASVFSGPDGSLRYALANSVGGDVRPLCKKLNAAFSGRGGGRRELAQGSLLAAREQLESFFGDSAERVL